MWVSPTHTSSHPHYMGGEGAARTEGVARESVHIVQTGAQTSKYCTYSIYREVFKLHYRTARNPPEFAHGSERLPIGLNTL
jgi:hypothetical protein